MNQCFITALCSSQVPHVSAPTLASIQQLIGGWRSVESKGSQEFTREWLCRKWAPWLSQTVSSLPTVNASRSKPRAPLKTTPFSCNLGETFATTAHGRKTQTVCNFVKGALAQPQEWAGRRAPSCSCWRREASGGMHHERCQLHSDL